MAQQRARHCTTKVNDFIAIVIGGHTGKAHQENISDSTQWVTFNKDKGDWSEWTDGPKLLFQREGHACESVVDPSTGSVFVVVAGGYQSLSPLEPPLDSTEFLVFDLEDGIENGPILGQSKLGPHLPLPLSYARFSRISFGSKLILLGGRGTEGYLSSIIEWECSESEGGCSQRLLGNKLHSPRSVFVALDASNMTSCSKTKLMTNKTSSHHMPEAIAKEKYCDISSSSVEDISLYRVLFGACCGGGNVCELRDGACERNDDCRGELVCGCNNCIVDSAGTLGYNIGENCCAKTRDSCNQDCEYQTLP